MPKEAQIRSSSEYVLSNVALQLGIESRTLNMLARALSYRSMVEILGVHLRRLLKFYALLQLDLLTHLSIFYLAHLMSILFHLRVLTW